jgi:biotin carboxyl carrier protein
MRYFVTLPAAEGSVDRQVDVSVDPSGKFVVSLGGAPVDADVVAMDDGALSVRIGARVLDLVVEGEPPELGVVASGYRAYVRVESERLRAAAAAKKGGAAAAERVVLAPMPGRVVKVLVHVGDEVAVGQGIVVVEAMKMENELRAKGAGRVETIHVAPGAAVEAGAKLISLA